MRAAGILFLSLAGLTAYWIVTGRGAKSGQTQEIISSPLDALGNPRGQGDQTLSSTGLTPPSFGFTPPPPVTPPNLNDLLQSGGHPNGGATALDPTQALLQGP